MRDVVCESAGHRSTTVRECRFSAAQLMTAKELFLTNSLFGVRPVRELEGRKLGIGAVTRAMAEALKPLGVGEHGS